MKNVVFALFVFVGAQAHADLTGKYKPVQGECHGARRVYISVQEAAGGPKGVKALVLNFYGDDAAIEEVLLGRGQRQAPGTDIRIHGKTTETWSTRFEGSTLISDVVTERPSTNLKYAERTIVSTTGTQVAISKMTVAANGSTSQTEICVLQRN